MSSLPLLHPRRLWPSKPSQTLVGRLTRTLIGFMGSIWLLSALGVAIYVDIAINRNFDIELTEIGERLFETSLREYGSLINTSEGEARTTVILGKPKLFPDTAPAYQLLDAQGHLLLRSSDVPLEGFGAAISPGFEDIGVYRVLTLKHPSEPLYFQVVDSLEERNRVLTTSLLTLMLPMIGALPLLSLALRRIARNELASLQALASEISERGSSDLRPIHQSDLPRELRILNDHVNRLLARLSQALDVERALAANAAHELRTPLAAARLRLQTALEHEPRHEHVQAALDALQALSHRAEKLLQLSRAESGASLTTGQVDRLQLVGAVAQEFWQAESGQARLHLKVPDTEIRPARGDFDALAIAVRNLVENGLRYGGDRVLLELDEQGTISVRDWGPGATPAQLRTLRQRHVRHQAHGAGYGLGLSIVQTIIEKHGGWLELSSPPPGATHGFEARIRLQSP